MNVLELHAVTRKYVSNRSIFGKGQDLIAVDGVTLSVAPGETLGIVGESGCGKSTTGRLALALENPSSGKVLFRGEPQPRKDSMAWRKLRRHLQMVFQDPLGALDRRIAVAEQIAEPLIIHGIGGKAERADRVNGLLQDVGLNGDIGSRFPGELSGGQRQRVVLARALATDPQLLVCDEPVSALDVSVQAQVVNLLVDLQASRNVSMIFISHDLKIVRQVSNRVAVMYLGRVVEQGGPDDVFREPAHPYTQALVSAIPKIGSTRQRIILSGDPPNPVNRPSGCAFHPRCRHAVAMCREIAPQLKSMSDGRLAACHLVHGDAQSYSSI